LIWAAASGDCVVEPIPPGIDGDGAFAGIAALVAWSDSSNGAFETR
jgi:hypothetical protein